MHTADSAHALIASNVVCSPKGQCQYNIVGNFHESQYTVTVAAENIVGRGQPVTCTPQQISKSMSLLNHCLHAMYIPVGSQSAIVAVTASTATEPAVVVCEFLSELSSPAQCEVCYGIDPPCQNLTCFSSPAAADGRAVVELPPLEGGVRYCYTVTASIAGATKALVDGTFITMPSKLEPISTE